MYELLANSWVDLSPQSSTVHVKLICSLGSTWPMGVDVPSVGILWSCEWKRVGMGVYLGRSDGVVL